MTTKYNAYVVTQYAVKLTSVVMAVRSLLIGIEVEKLERGSEEVFAHNCVDESLHFFHLPPVQ